MTVQLQDVAKINIYDILEPCYYPDSGTSSRRSNSRLPESFRRLGETTGPHKVRKRQFGRAYPLRLNLKPGLVPTWPSLSHALFDSEDVPCTVWSLHQCVFTYKLIVLVYHYLVRIVYFFPLLGGIFHCLYRLYVAFSFNCKRHPAHKFQTACM